MQRMLTWKFFIAMVAITAVVTKAQDSACLSELVPCLQFINSNKTPSSSCCQPLKSLIKSNPQCLCSLLGNDSATRQAGVNMTRAQLLPARCGDKVSAASCKKSSSKGKTTAASSSAEKLLVIKAMRVGLLSLWFQSMWVVFLS
ncbi:Plant non-specific lipid-transfer protein/Par allergen protein [Dioscorea alata]|uniref:Plant non-specific lipid-transfer protein/Par allergen protein n=2 Tax=Dioscorea alata TaxID=55571 RepID=A0ACB7WNA4_DIOAL|nr:Plant non-specific lipid-transfer protein/Par allergen protein [Dioscorea alata]KAH7690014.1 Plant non-specific lipid-transfer protein/Par allergen protein [Dioscorea alata]